MQHRRAVGQVIHAGIVSGGDIVKAVLLCKSADDAELGGRIAENAGVRRASGAVFAAEWQDDILLKLLMAADHMELDIKLLCDNLCSLYSGGMDRGELEDDALDLIALTAQQLDGDRRINAAA